MQLLDLGRGMQPAITFDDPAERAAFAAGRKAWRTPIPETDNPSFEFLCGYYSNDYGEYAQLELLAYAYPHCADMGSTPPITRDDVLKELARLSPEAAWALADAFLDLKERLRIAEHKARS
jgi:hypothetical protein